MQRRDFLRFGGAPAASATLAGCGGTQAETAGAPAVHRGKRYRWTLGLFVPEDWKIWGEGLKRFAAAVETMSGGRMEIKAAGKGGDAGPLSIFESVRDGDMEMGHAAAYFWDGKAGDDLRASPFFTTVPFGMTADGQYAWLFGGGGQALWEELYAPFDLVPIVLGSTGLQAGGWFRKPITSLDDLKGIKMRLPGLGGKVLDRAGGKAETLPGHELYIALETGRIDATEWVGPYHDYLRGFYKVAPYCYTGGWHEPGSVLELIINRQAWENLDGELQAIIRHAAAECDRWMLAQWRAKDAVAYQQLQANAEVTMAPYPAEVIRALKPFADEVLAEVRDSTPLAKRIHDSYVEFQRLHEAYVAVSEMSYFAARR